MKIQCSSCGASFEVNERTQSSVFCPYCGSTVNIHSAEQSSPAQKKFQRIIPFKISEQEAIERMLNLLVTTEGVPVDVFHHIEDVKVEKYLLPMFMLNGEIEAPWNATEVERRSRTVRRNGRDETEYYYEKWPINGYATSAYWLLSCANCKGDLPYALREYAKVIDYTESMASTSISDEVQEINYPLPEGCVEIKDDTDWQTVFNSNPVNDHIHQIGIYAAMRQLPHSYENFRCTPRWTNMNVESVGLAVYFVRFNYKGETYEFCIDGLGESWYHYFPQDQEAIESLRKSIRNKRIYTWLLCLFGIAMPLIGTFGITRWPVGLLLAFVAMPIAMLIILLILISKERRAILSNEEEQREYGRRVYKGLDTSDVDGNASTKLRVVTNILLWIGLAVDIAAIIISLTVSSPYAGSACVAEIDDYATENVEVVSEVKGASQSVDALETSAATDVSDYSEEANDDNEVIEETILNGTMTDDNGSYPIQLEFREQGGKLSECVYTNCDLGGKIRMTGRKDGQTGYVFTGKDGNLKFQITIARLEYQKGGRTYYMGEAMDGSKRLSIEMTETNRVGVVPAGDCAQ